MYLYFDELGVLKEIVGQEHFRQGSDNANVIYMYFAGDRVLSSLTLTFKVNDESVEPITKFVDVDSDVVEEEIPYSDVKLNYFKYYTTYKLYKYTLPSEVLAYSGVLKITPRAYFVGGNEALGLVVVNVENSVVVENPTITRAEYEDLLQQIANVNAKQVKLYKHYIECVCSGNYQVKFMIIDSNPNAYTSVDDILEVYSSSGLLALCNEGTRTLGGTNKIYQALAVNITLPPTTIVITINEITLNPETLAFNEASITRNIIRINNDKVEEVVLGLQ